MKKALMLALLVAVGFVFVVGCGGTQQQAAPGVTVPDWVMKGSGAFGGEGNRVFYGVGVASGSRNIAALRSMADTRALAEISKTFNVYVASLTKDYLATTMGGDPSKVSDEQHFEQAIKTVTSNTLVGVEVVERWQHPQTGDFYSLARLDQDKFKDAIEKNKELDKKAKEYIKQNADRLHDQLEKEEEKAKTR